MARVTVEDCLDKVDSRFALVLLVSKRAKQLMKGFPPTKAVRPGNKFIVNALREVADNKVRFSHINSDKRVSEIEADLNR